MGSGAKSFAGRATSPPPIARPEVLRPNLSRGLPFSLPCSLNHLIGANVCDLKDGFGVWKKETG